MSARLRASTSKNDPRNARTCCDSCAIGCTFRYIDRFMREYKIMEKRRGGRSDLFRCDRFERSGIRTFRVILEDPLKDSDSSESPSRNHDDDDRSWSRIRGYLAQWNAGRILTRSQKRSR
jgi:hypothetical protein